MSKKPFRAEAGPQEAAPSGENLLRPVEAKSVKTQAPTSKRNQAYSLTDRSKRVRGTTVITPTRKRKGLPVWLAVIVLGVVVWVVIAFFLLSGGKSDQKPVALLNSPDVHSLAFNPTRPEVVYFGSHSGLLKSQDNGSTWQTTNLSNLDAMGIGLSGDGRTIYISGHDVFSRSDDGGSSWHSLLDRLAGSGATDVHALAVDPASPSRLYIFAVGAGILKSEDSGQSWQAVTSQLGNGLSSLAFGNDTLWAAVSGRGVLRSQDGGVSWQAASGYANSALEASNKVTALTFEPATSMLYAGTSNGLFHSMDGGSSWNQLGYTGPVATLAVNPSNPKNIVLVSPKGEVFRSQDGGVSWPGK